MEVNHRKIGQNFVKIFTKFIWRFFKKFDEKKHQFFRKSPNKFRKIFTKFIWRFSKKFDEKKDINFFRSKCDLVIHQNMVGIGHECTSEGTWTHSWGVLVFSDGFWTHFRPKSAFRSGLSTLTQRASGDAQDHSASPPRSLESRRVLGGAAECSWSNFMHTIAFWHPREMSRIIPLLRRDL